MDKYLNFGKNKISYFDMGRGETIIFVHGWMSSKEVYLRIANILSKKYRCVGIDIPGFGKSKSINGLKIKDVSSLIHKFVNKMKIKKFHLVGHSMGGAISIIYANKHQDRIKKVILISPFISFLQFPKVLYLLLRYVLPNIINKSIVKPIYKVVKFFSDFVFEKTSEKIDINKVKKERIKKRAINAFSLMYQLSLLDLYKLLYAIRKDIMIVYGKKDHIINMDIVKPLLKISNTLNLQIFEDKRHFVYSYDAEDLSKKIDDFVGR